MSPSPSPSPAAFSHHSSSASDSSGTSSPMLFPLPAGYFGDVQVSVAKQQELHELVRHRVSTMLADERRYAERRAQQQPILHAAEWKYVRSLEELKIYRRRRRGRSLRELASEEDFEAAVRAVERGQPSMVAIGRVSGSIEDMLYGLTATTQDDMLTGFSYTAPPKDCALLRVLERATPEDALHSAELLWVLTKLPIVTPRDVCYLKATGVERDAKGQRFGYLVLHSVDVAECPPFDRRKASVLRAKMFFACLFREVTPGFVDVLLRGIFDLAGDLPKLVLPHATASFIGGVFNAVGCGEAKKLTLLARRSREGLRQLAQTPKQTVCSVCIKRGRKGLFTGVHLRQCKVCGVCICSRCAPKNTRMFLGVDRPCSVFVCCPNCAQQAKRMTDIRPYESQCLVVADFYLKHPTASSSSGSSTTAAALPLAPATQHVRLDTLSRTDEAGDREWTRPSGSVVLLADMGKTTSSVGMMTNSTTDESWAGHESIDGSYAETLSDLNSGEYRFSSGDEGVDDDLEQEKEPEPSPDVLAELLSQRARIDDQLRQVNLSASGQGSWGGERQRINVGDFTRSDPLEEDAGRVDNSATTPKPNALMERMRALQSTAEQSYAMTQANEEIMKSLH